MINYIKISFFVCLVFIGLKTKAQDFHLSMYDAAPLFLNPAMTGVLDGSWRVHGQYRTQWQAVNFKPYMTGLISFDAPVGKWGFGGQIANFRAGAGNYNVLQGTGSVGYTVPLDANKYHNISFGLQLGITQKTIEAPLYTFNNQYTISGGGSFDNNLGSNENFSTRSILLPVTNTGIFYYNTKQQSKINPFIGVSGFNLIQPRESFFEEDNSLLLRYYIHTGLRLNLTEKLYLIPKLLIMQQGKFTEQTLALDAGRYFDGSDFYLLGGAVFRNRDAAAFSIGVKKENYILRIGYDVNVSTLSSASAGRGATELFFTYTFKKEEPKFVKICPRL